VTWSRTSSPSRSKALFLKLRGTIMNVGPHSNTDHEDHSIVLDGTSTAGGNGLRRAINDRPGPVATDSGSS
jgi:hypothetical protein